MCLRMHLATCIQKIINFFFYYIDYKNQLTLLALVVHKFDGVPTKFYLSSGKCYNKHGLSQNQRKYHKSAQKEA